MSELFWLTEAQVERLRPFFPKSRGRARVDDRRVLSGIIYVNRGGLMWSEGRNATGLSDCPSAPPAYGPSKTLYNRWKRWGRMGVFARMMTELAAEGQDTETVAPHRHPLRPLPHRLPLGPRPRRSGREP